MSLKDELIKREMFGNKVNIEEPKPKEEYTTLEEKEDFSQLDLSDALNDELNKIDDETGFGEIDLSSLEEELNSKSEPEPVFEPVVQNTMAEVQEVPVQVQEPEPEEEEEEEEPEDTEDIDEPVKEHKEPKRRRRQKKEEIPSDDQTILGFKLLKLAKGIVLNDISENFESEIVTSSAMKKMISEYLGKEKSSISNSGAILSAVLDEVSEKHYDGNTSYGELTSEILDSIKSDLK